jgi:hypothetical protein
VKRQIITAPESDSTKLSMPNPMSAALPASPPKMSEMTPSTTL